MLYTFIVVVNNTGKIDKKAALISLSKFFMFKLYNTKNIKLYKTYIVNFYEIKICLMIYSLCSTTQFYLILNHFLYTDGKKIDSFKDFTQE